MNKNTIGFSIAGKVMCILFFIIANMTINNMAGVSEVWCIYPVFALLWWPMSMIACYRGSYKGYAIVSSFMIIIFLITVNYVTSPIYPWVVYAAYPAIWWPIVMFMGKKAGTIKFAVICSGVTIIYYMALNLIISSQYPWTIYIAYGVLWWPISLCFARKKQPFVYSIVCSSLSVLFFIIVNYVSSPYEIWCIYPIFGFMWWPLSMYYYYHKRRVTGTILQNK